MWRTILLLHSIKHGHFPFIFTRQSLIVKFWIVGDPYYERTNATMKLAKLLPQLIWGVQLCVQDEDVNSILSQSFPLTMQASQESRHLLFFSILLIFIGDGAMEGVNSHAGNPTFSKERGKNIQNNIWQNFVWEIQSLKSYQ